MGEKRFQRCVQTAFWLLGARCAATLPKRQGCPKLRNDNVVQNAKDTPFLTGKVNDGKAPLPMRKAPAIAVAEGRFAEHDGADTGLVDLDAFDPIRRHGTLDQGVFAQGFQFLRRLPGK